jgi:histone deacetylase 6
VQGEHYHEFVKEMWDPNCKKNDLFINGDTYYGINTYRAAFEAVRVTVAAMTQLLHHNCSSFYSIVRPPGHHSGMKSMPHGFCFFNNIAMAAHHALNSGKVKRVAILDWDAHHGEGTQKLFYPHNNVLYLSLHRYDNGKFFPHVK